jgi:hypothetical protein
MPTQILIIKKYQLRFKKKKKKSDHQTHVPTQIKLVSMMIKIFWFKKKN